MTRKRSRLQVPSDGSFVSLRALIDQFDGQPIAVASLSIHTPDLDDVFFAITGKSKAGAGHKTLDRTASAS